MIIIVVVVLSMDLSRRIRQHGADCRRGCEVAVVELSVVLSWKACLRGCEVAVRVSVILIMRTGVNCSIDPFHF